MTWVACRARPSSWGGDLFGIGRDDGRVVLEREIPVDPAQLDAITLLALTPGAHHVRVVVLGQHHLVPGLEIQAEDDGVQPLGGVAVDGQLLGGAARQCRQLGAQRLPPFVEDLPHGVRRPLVAELVVEDVGLLDHLGLSAHAPRVQVDDIRRERVPLAGSRPRNPRRCAASAGSPCPAP